ncbi:MAG: hypothetical protein DKM50_03955 [Candidatus Margulisiibacteriota bacterium]|nr:MAG: hypothetical protein A2X43_01670 [Candidatus Margulisbacteria bacterium GWD2_39_127]OGI05506.1 MAG: hypothetical protein A2X42_00165 [Candidatus Margulisbacteria bacterium GWF2_38_17]OGI08296.1 MAG: hypothetical protein A2X41_00080 [Candidatus Margulisbacteria bacterium GWE2_39_32]PZM82290.1 MAG: hypothetical protein DKM50_03955 [Candidatus Margulisiibacteriota bacterium]HAR62964.1 hypothetical protein [Candidatus Margulisiibacteriota bacterium]
MNVSEIQITKKHKILFDAQGIEIARHKSLKALLPKITDKNTTIKIKSYYKTKEIIIPEINNDDLANIISWKIKSHYPQLSKDYYYTFQTQKGQHSNHLLIFFIKKRYLEKVQKTVHNAGILAGNIFIDEIPLKTKAQKKSKDYLILPFFICILLFMTYNNILEINTSNEQVKQLEKSKSLRMQENKVEQANEIESVETTPVQTFQRESILKGMQSIDDFIAKRIPEGMKLESINFDCLKNKITFSACAESYSSLEKDIILKQVVLHGNTYLISGEYNVQP